MLGGLFLGSKIIGPREFIAGYNSIPLKLLSGLIF